MTSCHVYPDRRTQTQASNGVSSVLFSGQRTRVRHQFRAKDSPAHVSPGRRSRRTTSPGYAAPHTRGVPTRPRRSSAIYTHDLLPISALQRKRNRRRKGDPETSKAAREGKDHVPARTHNVGSTGRAPGRPDDADDVRVGGRRGEPHAHGPAVAGGPGRHPDREGAGQGRRCRGAWGRPEHLRRQEGGPRRQGRCRGNRHRRVILCPSAVPERVCTIALCPLLGCSVCARVECVKPFCKNALVRLK